MVNAAQKAGRALRRDFGEVENLQVLKKGPADFVTKADTKAEKIDVLIHSDLNRLAISYNCAFVIQHVTKFFGNTYEIMCILACQILKCTID